MLLRCPAEAGTLETLKQVGGQGAGAVVFCVECGWWVLQCPNEAGTMATLKQVGGRAEGSMGLVGWSHAMAKDQGLLRKRGDTLKQVGGQRGGGYTLLGCPAFCWVCLGEGANVSPRQTR